MCHFKSAICLKNRVFVPDYDNHSKMLEDLHIEDDSAHASKVFVRVELVPEDGDITSDIDKWELSVDQDILPDWWDETEDLPRIKAAVKIWCDIHILRDGTHTVRDGVWYVCDSASVTACDSASVVAYDRSTVVAYDSASVTAYDRSSVVASDRSTVTAYDRSKVTAFDRSKVTAYDSANVTAYDSANVTAFNSANVAAFNRSSVILPKRSQTLSPVLLYDEAICINYKDHTIQSPVKWEQK